MDTTRALEFVKEATHRANKMAAVQARDDFQDDSAPLTEQEQAEAEAVRMKAISDVGSALRIVRAQLAAINEKDAAKEKQAPDKPMKKPMKFRIPIPHRVPGLDIGSGTTDKADEEIAVPASATDLDSVTESVGDMLKGASNVINDFDEVLDKPFLEEFSASLDIVPVIGIQGRKLVYSKHTLVDGNASTAFAKFDDLPDDAPEDLSSAKVFPWNGDLYLSVGTAVWRKDHLNSSNDALADSVDNWPRTYQEGWFKLGDEVFPTEIIDAAFFGQLSNPEDLTSAPVTRILLLDSSGQLHTFAGTLQTSGNTFVPLTFTPSDEYVEEAPVWEKIAYTRGDLHGYANGVVWTLALSLSGAGETGTYTVQDKSAVGDVIEMEGNETGLVLRRDDGFLYQQHIQVSDPESAPDEDLLYEHPEAASGDPTLVELSYKRWIEVPSDVRMIGVASSGVELNLRILTAALKSRYLRTQTVLYPVVEKIRTFMTVHTFYLDYLETEADKFSSNPPTDEEAIAQASTYLTHISYWTDLINDAVTGVKGTVNIMASDAQNVKQQLKVQLSMIEEELGSLQAALKGLKTEKKSLEMKFALWIGGLVMTIVGSLAALAFFGMPVLGVAALGGGLFVAGVAGMVVASKNLAEVNQDIAKTEAKLRDLTTTHGQLFQISELYDGIDTAHEALNVSWGRMSNDAVTLQGIVGAFSALGVELLLGHLSFNIGAAKQSVDKLKAGCTAYLDLLNAQGVQVGATRSSFTARSCFQEWSKEDAFDPKACKPGPISEVELENDSDSFSRATTYGQQLLQGGDVKGYLKHLEEEIAPRGKITATVLKGEIVRVRV